MSLHRAGRALFAVFLPHLSRKAVLAAEEASRWVGLCSGRSWLSNVPSDLPCQSDGEIDHGGLEGGRVRTLGGYEGSFSFLLEQTEGADSPMAGE